MLQRELEELVVPFKPELCANVCAVILNCADADIEGVTDFFAAFSVSDFLQDLDLHRRKRTQRRDVLRERVPLRRPPENEVRDGGADEVSPPGDIQETFKEVGTGAFFQNISLRTKVESLPIVFFLLVHGQDHKFTFEGTSSRLLDHFETVESRHGDIQHRDIRVLFFDHLEGFVPVSGLTDQFKTIVPLDERPQTLAENRVVIGNNDFCAHTLCFR